MAEYLDCPMCGHRFDTESHQGCGACPLNQDCSVVCCPLCGHATIDPSRSRMARWIADLFFKKDSLDEKTA